MKIGLVRHFKVKHTFPKKLLLTADEVVEWFVAYESAEVEHKQVDLCGIEWTKCFSSPQERAVRTACTLFSGDILRSEKLKEWEHLPSMNKAVKLPFLVWGLIVRRKVSSSAKTSKEFSARISAFADELLSGEQSDTLIVSHFFVMIRLQKELLKRGFRGTAFTSPDHGIVYLFEK
ncbi:MAG: phosphoglycerate mutase [Bacteroidetes bacterium]|jgi:broad specificity phosphatase PhoE|nr:phosphoglycerate mutase [Bacteroidota bacterium]